ncbi:hypothetical protein ADEAN_000064000 [Angomonas deanei]|uniref:Uncharacterized protein n=1 Tax=Angomonas deanei TaxID=59799 RepID=A0A7G2C393_9TRYP|nr:hypothetical protein ADEAN_000064000 [Angomonas deanei]
MIKGATAALEAAAPETVLGFLANYFPSSELGRPIADFSSSEREDLMEDPMVSLCDDEQVNGALTLDKTMIPYEQLFSWKAESKTTRNVQPIDTKHLRELKVLQALLQRPTDLLKTTRFDVLKFVLKLKCAGFEKELARRIVAAYALLSSEAAAPWLSLPYTIYLSELLSVCTDLMVLWQPNDTFTAKSVLTLVEPEHELGKRCQLVRAAVSVCLFLRKSERRPCLASECALYCF